MPNSTSPRATLSKPSFADRSRILKRMFGYCSLNRAMTDGRK